MKVFIFWKCIQYTIYQDKTDMLKKYPLDKINGTKKCSLFLIWALAVLLLVCDLISVWVGAPQ